MVAGSDPPVLVATDKGGLMLTDPIPDIPQELIAPGRPVPRGYATCWAFLARAEPAVLSLMIDPVSGLADDERRARRIARTLGSPYMLFPAPDVLREEGLTEIGAYAQEVLERTFPEAA